MTRADIAPWSSFASYQGSRRWAASSGPDPSDIEDAGYANILSTYQRIIKLGNDYIIIFQFIIYSKDLEEFDEVLDIAEKHVRLNTVAPAPRYVVNAGPFPVLIEPTAARAKLEAQDLSTFFKRFRGFKVNFKEILKFNS